MQVQGGAGFAVGGVDERLRLGVAVGGDGAGQRGTAWEGRSSDLGGIRALRTEVRGRWYLHPARLSPERLCRRHAA